VLQVTIISIATMNIGKYYKAPYNIGVVGKVCVDSDLLAGLPTTVCTLLAEFNHLLPQAPSTLHS
jgi:hypothetical protein